MTTSPQVCFRTTLRNLNAQLYNVKWKLLNSNTQYGAITFNFNRYLPGMLSACSYMSMQINLQHMFKMSASRTRVCIGTTLAYTSDTQWERHGVRQSFKTRLHRVVFVEPGVKINGAYYRDVLLMQKLLPLIRQISGNEFMFQQDSVSAWWAPCSWDNGALTSRDAGLYFTGTVATEQSRS